MRVLIVDDNEQNLYMLRVLLEGHGHEVVSASDGAAALGLARLKPPDIAISDILMPVMDGFALCREWKRDDVLKRIPFIFYTATYTDRKDEEFARRLGADGFIVKPADPERFMELVRQVMEEARSGNLQTAEPSLESEEEAFRLYNQRLVRKLEKKMKDLEQAARESEEARKQAQEARDYAETIVETVRVPLAVLDGHLRLLSANGYFYNTFSFSPEDTAGMALFEIDGRRWDVPELRRALERVIAHDAHFEDLELEQEVPLAGRRALRLSARAIYGGGKKTGRILLVIEDVTEWKRMLEELRRSEEKYRELVENASSIVMRMDINGNITFFNEYAQKFFGYAAEEVLGRNAVGTIVPDEEENKRDLAAIAEEMAAESESHKTREYRNMRKDGSRVWVAWTHKAVLDDTGRIKEILAIGVDATAQKDTLRKLERINNLFLSLGADIIANIEEVLKAGREILGGRYMQYCRLQKGKLFSLLYPPGEEGLELSGEPREHLCDLVIGGGAAEPLIIEDLREHNTWGASPEVTKRGMRFFAAYPVRVRGDVIGCLSMWDDNPRKLSRHDADTLGTLAAVIAAEEERLAREESLKDLVDVASHELRHPMTLMKGYATSLRDLWGRIDDEQRLQMLNAIDYGVDRMEKVVRELLEVSRIERGRFRLNRQKAAIGPLVARAVSEMREKGTTNEFCVAVREGGEPPWVDPDRMVQLLVILLDNAVEFSPPGSRIEIEAEVGKGRLFVSVLDEGQGIPEGQEKRVFERFYQVEEANHHSKPGIGLGLYIAMEIVEAHGGKIWNEPRPGGGTAFRFCIPDESGGVPG